MYHHLSQYYDLLFPEQLQVNYMLKDYAKPGLKAVDLGCGTGRLTKVLHDCGMDVFGVDLDQEMINVAQKKYTDIEFKASDMVETLSKHDAFDLVTCFGNTLPHLDHKALSKFLIHLKASLKNEGYAIIQCLNYVPILKNKPKHLKPIFVNNITFERTYDYHSAYITFTTTLKIDHHITEGQTTIYPYTIDDLSLYLRQHELNFQFYGDTQLKPFQEDDYYLYIIITKS